MEKPTNDYDHLMFLNVGAFVKFALISRNRSFIKEKGFHQLEDFFPMTIAQKGGKNFANPLGQLPQYLSENSMPTFLHMW